MDTTVQLGARLTLTMCRQNYETGNIVTTSHYHYAFNNETQAAKEFTTSGINTNRHLRKLFKTNPTCKCGVKHY